MKRYTLLGIGAFAAFAIYQTYRIGQEHPRDDVVYRREMERMDHAYAHPLGEIQIQNALRLESLLLRNSELQHMIDAAVASLAPMNGSSSCDKNLRRLQELVTEELAHNREDIKDLRENNALLDYRGEQAPPSTQFFLPLRPLSTVLEMWYLGNQRGRHILEEEYTTRQAYETGSEISDVMKPLDSQNTRRKRRGAKK